jgi:transcriptional antiterminator NusG
MGRAQGGSVELKWYIVHTYSGFENRVKETLQQKIKSLGKEDYFGQVVVPTEQVIELVKGKKKTSSRKFYPGYVMIQMAMSDETWHIVQSTDKTTGFLGGKTKPVPISEEEAAAILARMQAGKEKPKPKFFFEEGDEIRVIDGPFTNFNGIVEEVKPDKAKLRVLISIFGRSTPVELDFVQVTKT